MTLTDMPVSRLVSRTRAASLVEGAAVGQPGQRIGVGVDLVQELLPLARHRDGEDRGADDEGERLEVDEAEPGQQGGAVDRRQGADGGGGGAAGREDAVQDEQDDQRPAGGQPVVAAAPEFEAAAKRNVAAMARLRVT